MSISKCKNSYILKRYIAQDICKFVIDLTEHIPKFPIGECDAGKSYVYVKNILIGNSVGDKATRQGIDDAAMFVALKIEEIFNQDNFSAVKMFPVRITHDDSCQSMIKDSGVSITFEQEYSLAEACNVGRVKFYVEGVKE